jgi:gliding motility-associated GldL-like protein
MNFEKIINTAYSFGAAIVVFGAWSKLEHKDYGSIALTAGLLTETVIFFIYGLMEWREQPPRQEQEQPPGQPGTGGNVDELTDTMKQTNRILNKVFRA